MHVEATAFLLVLYMSLSLAESFGSYNQMRAKRTDSQLYTIQLASYA